MSSKLTHCLTSPFFFLLALCRIQLHDHLVLHKLLPSLVFHDGVLFWFSCLTYLFLSSYGSYTNPLNIRVLQELILQSARFLSLSVIAAAFDVQLVPKHPVEPHHL